MKKLTTTILLATFVLCAAAQTSSRASAMIDSLMLTLARLGMETDVELSTHGGRRTIYSWASLNIPLKVNLVDTAKVFKFADNISPSVKEKLPKTGKEYNEMILNRQRDGYAALDSVRRTLDSISQFATESYHYETHRPGHDTIQYSICIDLGTDTIVEKTKSNRANRVYFHNAKEAISFDANSYPDAPNMYGNLQYRMEQRDTRNVEETLFDVDGFERMVCKILKPMKHREIHWRHPETPRNQKEDLDEYRSTMVATNANGTYNHGDTRGIVFTMPCDHEAEAEALLTQLKDSAYHYLNARPSLYYSYHFGTRYTRNDRTLLNVYYHPDLADQDRALHYDIHTIADDHGFYIFLLRTDGCLWVPKEMTTLKSFVDGKKVYLKGLEP